MGESFRFIPEFRFFFTSPDIVFVKHVNPLRYWGGGGGGGGGVGRPPDDLKGRAIHAIGIPCQKINPRSQLLPPLNR